MRHNKEYDFVVVGSGLFGSTFARLAHDAGFKSLVLERRKHLGGNIYCEEKEGINVHKYGPHIFHTSNEEVWNFVNSHVTFNNFINSPLAYHEGKLYHLPFNMNTFYQLWGVKSPEEAREIIKAQSGEEINRLRLNGIDRPRNLEEMALTLVGPEIYTKLIKEYTEKQWGRKCTELPPSIISRLPLRFSFDNNYFNDRFQGIPNGGYNRLISSLLKGIELRTETDFLEAPFFWKKKAHTMVFTGQIDEYFNYRYGRLQYRTLRWDTAILDLPNHQGNAVINYTDYLHPYTRIIEHKHFEFFGEDVYKNPVTVISREFSDEWDNSRDPFYPINDTFNENLLSKYNELAQQEMDTIFGGRLAEYKYYDMDDVIERAIETFNSIRTSL